MERTSVIKFIGRMVQQILPPGLNEFVITAFSHLAIEADSRQRYGGVGRLVLLPEIERRSAVPGKSSYKDLIELWWGKILFAAKSVVTRWNLLVCGSLARAGFTIYLTNFLAMILAHLGIFLTFAIAKEVITIGQNVSSIDSKRRITFLDGRVILRI